MDSIFDLAISLLPPSALMTLIAAAAYMASADVIAVSAVMVAAGCFMVFSVCAAAKSAARGVVEI